MFSGHVDNQCAVCVDQKTSEEKEFWGFLEDLDNKVKAEALSKGWFGKPMAHKDTIGRMYNPSIKLISDRLDRCHKHMLRYKIPDNAVFFDDNRNLIRSNHIEKGGKLRAIIFPLVWMMGNRFGVSWKIIQGMVWKPQRRFPGPQAFPNITASL